MKLSKKEINEVLTLSTQVLEQLLKDLPETLKEIKEIIDKKLNEE